MARSKRRKVRGIEPAQRTIFFVTTPSGGEFDVVVDVAKELSAINRRLYRQGMQYYVSDVSIVSSKGNVFSMVSTAGDTWMVHNAWKKAYNFWRSQQKQVDSVMPGLQGKWADFKVSLWDGASTPLTSIAGSDVMTPDEWNLSNYVWDDDGTERTPTFTILGTTAVASKIGMVQEYHISRAEVQHGPKLEADASESIYGKSLVNDEAMVALIDVIESENDLPPYDQDQMLGGDTYGDEPLVQHMGFSNGNQGASHTGGFTAECGLIRITGTSHLVAEVPRFTDAGPPAVYNDIQYFEENLDESIIIQVTIAPGPYKGVMASRMGQ